MTGRTWLMMLIVLAINWGRFYRPARLRHDPRSAQAKGLVRRVGSSMMSRFRIRGSRLESAFGFQGSGCGVLLSCT